MSTDQTHISVVTDEALTVGLKSWSRGQKVRLLLRFAQVEYRPSWAPPISIHTLSAAVEHSAISCRAIAFWGKKVDCGSDVPCAGTNAMNVVLGRPDMIQDLC